MDEQTLIDQLNARAPAFIKMLGGTIVAVDPEKLSCTFEFTISTDFCHSIDVVQGGFITAMLDAAMSHVAFSSIEGITGVSSLEIKTSYLEPTRAGRLRAVVAEHRAGQRQLHRLRPRAHAVLNVRTHDASGRLGPQRPAFALALATTGLYSEEFLLHHIGHLADASFEQVRLLEERRLDGLVAISPCEVACDRFETQERGALGGQQITGAPGGLKLGHGLRF